MPFVSFAHLIYFFQLTFCNLKLNLEGKLHVTKIKGKSLSLSILDGSHKNQHSSPSLSTISKPKSSEKNLVFFVVVFCFLLFCKFGANSFDGRPDLI